MDTYDLRDTGIEPHEKIAEEFINDKRKKAIKRELENLMDDELWNLQDYAASHIEEVACQKAVDFIKRVLNGDKEASQAIFECGDSSRYREIGLDAGEPWAHLIHGSLFETGAISLRRKLVEVHVDLLRNERIKDLESIEDGLTRQVRKLESDLAQCRERL